MPDNFSRILIIQTAFLGDVILTTSLVEKLSVFFPNAKIDFLVKKGSEVLLQGNPKLNETLILDKKKKFTDSIRIIKLLRSSKYDLAINVQRHFTTGMITVLSGAKVKVGFKPNPLSIFFSRRCPFEISVNSGQHEVERIHSLIEEFTDKNYALPKLYFTDKDVQKITELIKPSFITIHPGSVWFTKQWPKEKWIEFIEKLDEDIEVYLLGGPNERNVCEEIAKGSGREGVINLSGDLNLIESAALMQKAKMNYVNDSAPLHICSAIGAPCVAVFCSTVPEFGFGPLSSKSFVVETSEKLYCRPCGNHGLKQCPEGHFKCALDIKVQQLLEPLQSNFND